MAGCVTTADSLRTESLRLEDRSADFYAQIRYQGEDGYRDRISRDAQALTMSARDFNQAVAANAPREAIADRFSVVAASYDRLHQDLAAEGYADQNRQVLEEFDRVTAAYRDLEAAMGDRYARAY